MLRTQEQRCREFSSQEIGLEISKSLTKVMHNKDADAPSTFFDDAFTDIKMAGKMLEWIVSTMNYHQVWICKTYNIDPKKWGETKWFHLPPLFVITQDDFVLRKNDVLFLGFHFGPVIPIVLSTLKPESLVPLLTFVYAKEPEHSNHHVKKSDIFAWSIAK